MDKIPMNLEQTVQYLLDEVNKLKAGIAPGELIPGPQGVQGPEGPKPEVSISNATGNWVIDGVDTGKPSRGKQGEKGNTGMQGVPGVGVATMLSIDSTDYAPTVTDDGNYQNVESSADIKYSDGGVERNTQVDFNIKVPTHETFAGDGLTKNGRTLSVDRNMTPVYDDFGHYAGLVPMTTGDRVWGQAFMSRDPVPYAIAQRNSSGGLTGIQEQLYIHEGKLHLGTNTYLYKFAVRGKPTSFEEVTDVFPTEPEVCHYIWTVPVGTSNGSCILKCYTLVDEDEIRYYVLSSPGSRKTGSISDDNTYIVYDSVYAV